MSHPQMFKRRFCLSSGIGITLLATSSSLVEAQISEVPTKVASPQPLARFGPKHRIKVPLGAVTLRNAATYIRGFPVLLQFTVQGANIAPKMRLDTRHGEVQAIFIETEKKTSLIFQGGPRFSGAASGTAIGPNGEMFSPPIDNSANRLRIDALDRRATILFDLTALIPSGLIYQEGHYIFRLEEIPDGRYNLQGALTDGQNVQRTENTASIEVRAPSALESQWLRDVETKWREHIEMLSHDPRANGRTLIVPDLNDSKYSRFIRLYSTGEPFTWLNFLELPIALPATNKLSIAAQHTLAPYLFFSKFLLTPYGLENYPLAELEKFAVLPYLESEKQVWKYELLKARKLDDSSMRLRKSIEFIWPGMKWRLDEIDQNKGLLKTLQNEAYVVPIQKCSFSSGSGAFRADLRVRS